MDWKDFTLKSKSVKVQKEVEKRVGGNFLFRKTVKETKTITENVPETIQDLKKRINDWLIQTQVKIINIESIFEREYFNGMGFAENISNKKIIGIRIFYYTY